jgi:hypothetical protein
MPKFTTIKELFFPRTSRSGKPERLYIELVEVDGKRFVSLKHFWQSHTGEFCPPSRDAPRVTIRSAEAEDVIRLLRDLLPATRDEPPPTRD